MSKEERLYFVLFDQTINVSESVWATSAKEAKRLVFEECIGERQFEMIDESRAPRNARVERGDRPSPTETKETQQ